MKLMPKSPLGISDTGTGARNIYWSEEDEVYVAEVPALPGCVVHGASYAAAAKAIDEATKLWLASAEKHGNPVPDTDLAIEEIERLPPLLNLSKLARIAGINKYTLASSMPTHPCFLECLIP